MPACPGWTVADVIVHLTFGLGRGYPTAMRTAANATESDPIDWPTSSPRGDAVLPAFAAEMEGCVAAFRAADPTTPCWTYAGPGTAAFWFRRAAIETGLHRMDASEATGVRESMLEERTNDAVVESVEFALPLGAAVLGIEPKAIDVRNVSDGSTIRLGEGPASAMIEAPGSTLLDALWGRGREAIDIDGDRGAVDAWLGVIESAFSTN
ncbi:MAG: maleylpyruvate isomerase family mycothiol-dependent enzyme [Acidimicrobiales bacterium]|nr:maleylpyruvate isomerase family mycothiol-dependent enzyme [Acidimicrobiales bacterium]